MWRLASKHRRTGRGAGRGCRKRVKEQSAFSGNAIKIGRLYNFIAVTARVRPGPIVGQKIQDIRARIGGFDRLRFGCIGKLEGGNREKANDGREAHGSLLEANGRIWEQNVSQPSAALVRFTRPLSGSPEPRKLKTLAARNGPRHAGEMC